MDKKEILVVDDEMSIRRVLTQVLEKDGYAVTAAASGEEGLGFLGQKEFALVISDIKMPGMTGLELLKEVKEHCPDTQVIIITSFASLETALEALRSGAYDYLLKPFDDLSIISAGAKRAIEKVCLIEENRSLLNSLQKKNAELKSANKILNRIACRDALTGLYNHQYFQDFLNAEIKRCQRTNRLFSLLFFDLDHFKCYNDNNGHQMGDRLLSQLAGIMRDYVRESDIVARYGGEEFVVILPDTPKKGAEIVAEKLRIKIENYPFDGCESQPEGRVTASIGIASYPEDGTDRSAIIRNADVAMYSAKNSGRNRICSTAVNEDVDSP
jgi:diguanylate cyclase (GGDEF)-like protein